MGQQSEVTQCHDWDEQGQQGQLSALEAVDSCAQGKWSGPLGRRRQQQC